MNDPQPISPRSRLQALLAIPDSQRTEAQWDELNELEISLAPGNREGARDPAPRNPAPRGEGGREGGRGQNGRRNGPPAAARQKQAGAGTGAPVKKPFKKFHKKPPPPKGGDAA